MRNIMDVVMIFVPLIAIFCFIWLMVMEYRLNKACLKYKQQKGDKE